MLARIRTTVETSSTVFGKMMHDGRRAEHEVDQY